MVSTATYLAQLLAIPQIALALTKEQATAMLGLKPTMDKWRDFIETLNPSAGTFSVVIPLISMTKAEVVELGVSLAVPYEKTWSCIGTQHRHCGTCLRCIVRKQAFQSAGADDPTDYAQ